MINVLAFFDFIVTSNKEENATKISKDLYIDHKGYIDHIEEIEKYKNIPKKNPISLLFITFSIINLKFNEKQILRLLNNCNVFLKENLPIEKSIKFLILNVWFLINKVQQQDLQHLKQ